MPTKYYALFAAAVLLTASLFFLPQEDCSVFYGRNGPAIGEALKTSGCTKLAWPQSILDKIR